MNTRNEIIKRYMYLYQNKELILALCIGTGIEKEKLEKKIKESERLLSSNSVYNRELMKLELENANYDLEHEKYYLMANVNDSIVDMYEDFLFSDKEMEELDLYKHIEGVKNSKYLDVFNTLIENLETRRKRNFHLKKVPTFTVWKILSYVRRKNIDNRLGEYCLVKYPSTILMTGGIINDFENNSFEIEDDYYDGLFELSCIEEMSLMSNISVEDKRVLKVDLGQVKN